MAKITVVFKGGATIDIDVESFAATRGTGPGFTEVSWKPGKDRPLGFDPSEIVAVIERKK